MAKLDDKVKQEIDALSHESLAHIYRFAEYTHPYICIPENWEYFKNTLAKKGGITPEISKRIGW